jgi:dipeptidyl aminopeptidase/acylaminoacyl peptidase
MRSAEKTIQAVRPVTSAQQGEHAWVHGFRILARARQGARALAAVLGLAVLLQARAQGPAAPSPREGAAPAAMVEAGALALPPGLHAFGMPPVPRALASAAAASNRYEAAALTGWHPVRRELLVSRRAADAGVSQVFELAAPQANARRLTRGQEPVAMATWEPREGRFLVLQRAQGGNEAFRLYRHDGPGEPEVALTDAEHRWQFQLWLPEGDRFIASAVPLDRTAEAGTREDVSTVLWLIDPVQPGAPARLAALPGSGWRVAAASPDGRQLALERRRSAEAAEVWLMELPAARLRRVLPREGEPEASERPVGFDAAGAALWLLSDRQGEFRELVRLDLATGQVQRLSADLGWDVEAAALSHDRRWIALVVNVDGRGELRLLDVREGRLAALPALPPGSVTRAIWHPQRNELAFSVSSVLAPHQLYTLEWPAARVQAWMRPPVPAPGRELAEPKVVRWPSFDGLMIPGLLHLPPARFAGPRPVFVSIHGGPESQARAGYAGRYNLLLQELGIAVLQPNVRGSSGYGKRYLGLDNGRLREDAVKDIGALLDWIATQPQLDASRVVVAGGSYGGYMSLAVAATYPERIAGSISTVGISHFVSFLRRTESYRRDLRRAEYGDERDPAMRDFLDRISPLTNAHRIARPLFVVQGRNDPRVPWTEAEQIVQRVRAQGTPVWYLLADNEGHGFTRRENTDYLSAATALFLRQVMGLTDP